MSGSVYKKKCIYPSDNVNVILKSFECLVSFRKNEHNYQFPVLSNVKKMTYDVRNRKTVDKIRKVHGIEQSTGIIK